MPPPNLYACVHIFVATIARKTAGAARTRSSLRPLISRARFSCKTPGALRRENANSYLSTVIPGWSEGPDPEVRDSGFDAAHRPGMTSIGRGVLDTPPARGTTARCGAASSSRGADLNPLR